VETRNEKKEKYMSEGEMSVLQLKGAYHITVTEENEVQVGLGLTNRIHFWSVHTFVWVLNTLFFTQIIKQSINYVFSSIIQDSLPTFGQVFDPRLEEIRRFGLEEVVEPILELSAVVEGNSA
jgi:hypothetical protein